MGLPVEFVYEVPLTREPVSFVNVCAELRVLPLTKAVVASWVVLVPAAAVGAVGVPVNAGETVETALASTKAVVAICVVFVDRAAVGAVGVPVSAGEASGAYEVATNAVVAICVVLVPAVAVGAAGVPVNVGDASKAYPVAQLKPTPDVYCRLLPVALHEGTASAVGTALEPVALPSTVLAA